MSHVVIFEGGVQTLGHVVSEVITAATYEITDLTRSQGDADRVLSSGAATVPSYTLTTSGDAGPGQPDGKLIPTGTTAGPGIGDPTIITAPDGAREAMAIEAISLDAYVKASSFLGGTYPAGSTIEGTRITAPTSADLHDFEDALDDQRPLRILWTYTTTLGELRASENIELKRGTLATASVGPAIQALLSRWPDLKRNLQEGLSTDALAADALAQVVVDLAVRGQDHASIMQGKPGERLLVAKMLSEAARGGYAPGQRVLVEFRDEAQKDYGRQLEALTSGLGSTQTIGLDTDHTSNQRPDQRYWGPILSL